MATKESAIQFINDLKEVLLVNFPDVFKPSHELLINGFPILYYINDDDFRKNYMHNYEDYVSVLVQIKNNTYRYTINIKTFETSKTLIH